MTITEKLAAALAFDEIRAEDTAISDIYCEMVNKGGTIHIYCDEFIAGAKFENERLAPLHAALIECALACEKVGVWAKQTHMLAGPLLEAHNALARLRECLGEIKCARRG